MAAETNATAEAPFSKSRRETRSVTCLSYVTLGPPHSNRARFSPWRMRMKPVTGQVMEPVTRARTEAPAAMPKEEDIIMTRMLKTSLRLALASTILGGGAVIMAVPAAAQTTTASVSGQVSDASGAPVAGATVVAVNSGTNQTFRATTDAAMVILPAQRPAPRALSRDGHRCRRRRPSTQDVDRRDRPERLAGRDAGR